MNKQALLWLLLNLGTIIILAFYSMQEMACVSFNKVRLQYYVSKGNRRAIWLKNLLQSPSRLFGTTLIGVNVATIVGSECAREFHRSIGIDPNWAPLSQVILVVIFGELAPMFAARHYPEHVAMAGIPIIYASSKIAAPVIWVLGALSKGVNRMLGNRNTDPNAFLSQEELQKIIEEQEEDPIYESDVEEINFIASNIFRLRGKNIFQVMTPLASFPMLSSNATITQLINLLQRVDEDFIPIYHRSLQNIVGIALPRELIRVPEARRVRDYCKSPWFITQNSKLTDVLHQFRRNNESVAVVINEVGASVGILTLDDLLNEIFGKTKGVKGGEDLVPHILLKNRTFPGELPVGEFNRLFHHPLSDQVEMTLSQLVKDSLGHPAEEGDTVALPHYEITVKEATLLDIKKVVISSRL